VVSSGSQLPLRCGSCGSSAVITHQFSVRSARSASEVNFSVGCVPCYSYLEGVLTAGSDTCSATDRVRLELFLNRCKRWSFAEKDLSSVTDLFREADDTFLERINDKLHHVLQSFLPEKPDLSYNPRERRSLITTRKPSYR